MPELSPHARARMAERHITEDHIRSALNRKRGRPFPGDNGRIVVLGYGDGKRILRVVLTPDQKVIISVMWLDD
jgi:uncharacterized protein DUF4258